jgi:hypothetical protein
VRSTSAVNTNETPTLAEMLDEIQQSRRRLLSQPSPLLLPTGRSPLVSATVPTDALQNSNVETQSASATLSATYDAIAHLGTTNHVQTGMFGHSYQHSNITAQVSSTLSSEKKYEIREFNNSRVGSASESLSFHSRPTSPLALLLEIGKQEVMIHKEGDNSKSASGAIGKSVSGNDFEAGNLLRPSGIEDLYRKLMSGPAQGEDDDCTEVPPPDDDGSWSENNDEHYSDDAIERYQDDTMN